MKLSLKKLLSKLLQELQYSSGTGSISFTKGAMVSGSRLTYVKKGWVVQTSGNVKATAAVASGANLAEGTVTGIPKPVGVVQTVTYYGNNAVVSQLTAAGILTARNCGADALASGNDAGLRWVYITDGTML